MKINWPNGNRTIAKEGDNWILAAKKAGIEIPVGCLGGSCGACEIEVNGEILRSCINEVKTYKTDMIDVNFSEDPYW